MQKFSDDKRLKISLIEHLAGIETSDYVTSVKGWPKLIAHLRRLQTETSSRIIDWCSTSSGDAFVANILNEAQQHDSEMAELTRQITLNESALPPVITLTRTMRDMGDDSFYRVVIVVGEEAAVDAYVDIYTDEGN